MECCQEKYFTIFQIAYIINKIKYCSWDGQSVGDPRDLLAALVIIRSRRRKAHLPGCAFCVERLQERRGNDGCSKNAAE